MASAGAKAFEWQQEIGLNQARRTGEVAVLDGIESWGLEEVAAAASSILADGPLVRAASADAQVSFLSSSSSSSGPICLLECMGQRAAWDCRQMAPPRM